MSEDEQRQIKANLLLEIHENEVLQSCINVKVGKMQKTFERLSWALKGPSSLSFRDTKLDLGKDSPYPTEEDVVELIKERDQAILESNRLRTLKREMGLVTG